MTYPAYNLKSFNNYSLLLINIDPDLVIFWSNLYESVLSRVVLPDPLAPIIATNPLALPDRFFNNTLVFWSYPTLVTVKLFHSINADF